MGGGVKKNQLQNWIPSFLKPLHTNFLSLNSHPLSRKQKPRTHAAHHFAPSLTMPFPSDIPRGCCRRGVLPDLSPSFFLSLLFSSLSLSNCHSQIMQAPLLEYLRPTVVQPPPSPRFVATSAAIARIGVLGKFLGVLGWFWLVFVDPLDYLVRG